MNERAPVEPPDVPLWRNRSFLSLWIPAAFSLIGTELTALAIPLLVLARTGSPAHAGLVGAARGFPMLLLMLPAGAIADRIDRRKLMIACEVGRTLAMATVATTLLTDSFSLAQLYAVTFIEGALFTLFDAADTAAFPRVVTVQRLPAAMAALQAVEAIALAIGPPLGGIAYGVGAAIPFAVDAATYAVSALGVSLITVRLQEERSADAATNIFGQLREGISWFWQERALRVLALLTAGVFAASMGFSLVLIILAQKLGASATGAGLTLAGSGVGIVVGGVGAAHLQRRLAFRTLLLLSLGLWTASWPAWLIAPNVFALAALVAVGFMGVAGYYSVSRVYRMSVIPDRLQGRVNAVFKLLIWGAHPVSMALSGLSLDLFGPRPTVLAIAATMSAIGIAAAVHPDLRSEGTFTELCERKRRESS